jgi:hypothetical protein
LGETSRRYANSARVTVRISSDRKIYFKPRSPDDLEVRHHARDVPGRYLSPPSPRNFPTNPARFWITTTRAAGLLRTITNVLPSGDTS